MALDITTLASTDKLSDSRGDINTNFTNVKTDLDALSDNLENLTDGEVTQLEAIGATTISAAQWAYLGDLDQALKKASSITFADLTLSGLTASELTATDASKKLQSLAVATYPSLTEISYIKGLSSAIQTQLAGKAAVDQTMYIGTTAVAINRTSATLNLAGIGTLGCGAITSTGNIDIGNNVILGNFANLTDDAATSFTPGTARGVITIGSRSSAAATINGIFIYRATASGQFLSAIVSNNIATTTGVLDGTTGADGNFTISVHTDGKIYIENRTGDTVYMGWGLLGMDV